MKYLSLSILGLLLLVGAGCTKKDATTVSNENQNQAVIRLNSNAATPVNDSITGQNNPNTNTTGYAPTSNVNSTVPQVQLIDDSTSTLASPTKVAGVDATHYFIVGQPKGQNSKATKKIIFSLPGHGSTAETDYDAWKPQIADNDYAVASLNWWDGSGETTQDYLTPAQVLSAMKYFLTFYGYDNNDFVVLEGFSRGSANTYSVASYDVLSGSPVIDAVISASGKYQSDFPLAPGALNVATLYKGIPWILACGDKDPNSERDGCVGMSETKSWLTSKGANVLAQLEDPNGGHGAFHTSPLKLVDQALALFDKQI